MKNSPEPAWVIVLRDAVENESGKGAASAEILNYWTGKRANEERLARALADGDLLSPSIIGFRFGPPPGFSQRREHAKRYRNKGNAEKKAVVLVAKNPEWLGRLGVELLIFGLNRRERKLR